jgi:hypothetical protein
MAFPTAQEAQALSLPAFDAFCREHRYSRAALVSRRYAHLMDPAPQANPIAVEAHRDQIRILSEVLLPQVQRRAEALSSLAHLFSRHPDAFLFDSLPGVGELLAPALLAKFGDHRDRFPTPASVQALAGACPVTQQSGKRKGSSSAVVAIASSAASPSSSPRPPSGSRAGPWPTGVRSALAVAPTLMSTAGWPIAGWPSSGRCGKSASCTTSRTTYNSGLSVAGPDPSARDAVRNRLKRFEDLASRMLTRKDQSQKHGVRVGRGIAR